MQSINIIFQAYIPKSLGNSLLSYFQQDNRFNLLSNKEEFTQKLRAKDCEGYCWIPEPGGFTNNYFFAADDVDYHDHHSYHTIRLGVEAKINPEKIGSYGLIDKIFEHDKHKKWGGINSQHSGESHRVEAYIKKVAKGHIDTGTTFIASDYEYIGVCNSMDSKRSYEKPLKISISNSTKHFYSEGGDDTTTIKVSGSANYPFLEYVSPNIDFNLSIELHKDSNSKIDVDVSGTHNEFPAYELVINNRVAYAYNPRNYGHRGPNYYNLVASRNFSVSEWVC